MPKAFDTTGCGIDAPDAIESFRLVSNCVIDLPAPPILEPDDLDLFIPTDFAQGSLEFPCPDVTINAQADTLPNGPEGEAAEATVEVEELPVPGSLGCAHSFLFKFGVPQGPRGLRGSDGRPGSRGSTGSRGPTGPCSEIDISADVTVVGSDAEGNVDVTPGGSACRPSFHFLFTLPRGERGSRGSVGPQGPQGPPGDDGITTVITDCADPAGTVDIGPYVKSVSLSSNGFNRIYLDVVSAPITVSLSDCGVISLVEGDSIFERQRTLLDLQTICNYCCTHECGSSSSSDDGDCGVCTFSIEIGADTYQMSELVPGLVWQSLDGDLFLFAPGDGVCTGDWRIERQVEGEPVCTWVGYWNGLSCIVLYLDGPTSVDCPYLTAYICCEDGPPGSGGSSAGAQCYNCIGGSCVESTGECGGYYLDGNPDLRFERLSEHVWQIPDSGWILTRHIDGEWAGYWLITYATNPDCLFAIEWDGTSFPDPILAGNCKSFADVAGGCTVPDEWPFGVTPTELRVCCINNGCDYLTLEQCQTYC